MIGVFGGTFDPVHNGHLQLALFVYQTLRLHRIQMIPCGVPAHRGAPGVSAEQRMAMLRLALFPFPCLVADDREIKRPGPSYMVDTLVSLRRELADKPDEPVCLIIGADSFQTLDSWSRWQSLLDYAHLVVLQRPGWDQNCINAKVSKFCQTKVVASSAVLRREPAGKLLFLTNPLLPIAASSVRSMIGQGENAAPYLALWVWDYIRKHGLYDVATPTLSMNEKRNQI